MTRPTFKDFKEKALSNPSVREEYEASAAAFAVKRQLIALRHQAGLTQEQMAERLGTQKSNISRLENLSATHSPKLETIEQYAHQLGYSVQLEFVPLHR